MVDAGPVFPADRLAQLRVIGWQISGEQTQIAPDNILPQRPARRCRIYIDSVKANLVGQLENTYILQPDGTKKKVTKK